MHKNGWKPFWAALGAALLVLLPLVGGTVLLTRQMVRTRIQTAQPQSGVPIQLPRAEHRMTLLLCTAGEQPGFLLVYLNAAQNSLNLLAVPGELTVPFNGETASLAHCYGAAGPARCRQALLEVLGLPEDMLYLALSPAVLEKTASRYGPVRVGFSGALTADELAKTGLSAAVQSISAKEAHALLSGWDADGCRLPVGPLPGRQCGKPFSGRTSPCCPPPCRMPCGPAARPCSPTLRRRITPCWARSWSFWPTTTPSPTPRPCPGRGMQRRALTRSQTLPGRQCRPSSAFRPPRGMMPRSGSHSPAQTFRKSPVPRQSGHNRSTGSGPRPAPLRRREGRHPAGHFSALPTDAGRCAGQSGSARPAQKQRAERQPEHPAGPCRPRAPGQDAG